ncbi:hypothetical protein OKA05_24305 [Luteolibacter arcticus]|uniref:PEP-CTERM sorting domain-containing protein n=1 Tax=Luteolibacter arcticus TaxID=1581411 RepID=A0ABT3GQB4_9BACT|nr:hypothetical protein [Luteolibacter arcticus]MCW1925703.1 hypothetical protein [Luteolibacter arcticus]
MTKAKATLPLLAIIAASFAAISSPASAAMVLLNGATESRTAGFTTFLDNTTAGTVAWGFNKGADHIINSSGALSTVRVEAVTNTGAASPGSGTAPTINISNSENGGVARVQDINAYSWGYGYSGTDLAERNEIANDGGGLFSLLGTLTVVIPNSVATTGQIYHVELLSIGIGAGNSIRIMNVSANGTPYVTNWNVVTNAANHYSSVLEFDVMADANGISLSLIGGTDAGDKSPYISAMSLTPIPEPSVPCLLGGLGALALLRRRRLK